MWLEIYLSVSLSTLFINSRYFNCIFFSPQHIIHEMWELCALMIFCKCYWISYRNKLSSMLFRFITQLPSYTSFYVLDYISVAILWYNPQYSKYGKIIPNIPKCDFSFLSRTDITREKSLPIFLFHWKTSSEEIWLWWNQIMIIIKRGKYLTTASHLIIQFRYALFLK